MAVKSEHFFIWSEVLWTLPEWCYYDEQVCKAEALAARNLAVYAPRWPGSFAQWRQLVDKALLCDLEGQRALVDDQAAAHAARFLEGLIADLWENSTPDELAMQRPFLHCQPIPARGMAATNSTGDSLSDAS